jgi:DNA-binding beta-propeller fold protein YncE
MRKKQTLRVTVISAAFALSAIRASSAVEFVYVENFDSREVSVIDIPGHTVVSTIKLGLFLGDVTCSHDGRILYVNRYDSLGRADEHAAESGEVSSVFCDLLYNEVGFL